VRLEANTKPPIHNLIHEILINMACPNFKKGLKMAFGPLGVKLSHHMKIHHVFHVSLLEPYYEFRIPGQIQAPLHPSQ
jgi:hypothetical protein